MKNDSNEPRKATSSGLARFLAELRRRHVFRTLLGYGAVVFVVLQLSEIVLPAFDVRDWVLQLVVVVSVLGFPVVLALAWVYEITPRGIRTMEAVDEEAGYRPEHGRLLPRVALLSVAVLTAAGAGLYWVQNEVPSGDAGSQRPFNRPFGRAADFVAGDGASSEVPIRSLAVLPLESFSPPLAEGPDGEEMGHYFASGMHEALISRLSRLETAYRVVSRTSSQGVDTRGKSIAQIGRELGVEGIVEGSVVVDGDRVRITVQLIHAPSDAHIWAGDYERDLDDVLALQREVASEISEAILGELEGAEGPTGPVVVGGLPVAEESPAGPADGAANSGASVGVRATPEPVSHPSDSPQVNRPVARRGFGLPRHGLFRYFTKV